MGSLPHFSVAHRAMQAHRVSGLVPRRSGHIEFGYVIDNSLTPSVDVRPLPIPNTVASTGHVDYVALPTRRRNLVMRLLIGNDDETVVAVAAVGFHSRQGRTQIRSGMRLTVVESIAQSHSATRGTSFASLEKV